MKFGPTIRQIRQNKKISLKACYTGIVVKSFAIRFEKGEVNLNVVDFLQVLNQLAVTPEEFLFLHFKKANPFIGGPLQVGANQIFKGTLKAKEAKNLYENYRESSNPEEKLLAYLSHFYLSTLEESDIFLPEEEKAFIMDSFVKNENWTLVEVFIFPTVAMIFPAKLRESLVKRCLKTIDSYQNFANINHQDYYAYTLMNYIFNQLSVGDAKGAFTFLPTFKKHLEKNPLLKGDLWLRIQLDLFKAVEGFIQEDEAKVLENLKALKEKCIVMGFPKTAQAYLEKYQEIVKKLEEEKNNKKPTE